MGLMKGLQVNDEQRYQGIKDSSGRGFGLRQMWRKRSYLFLFDYVGPFITWLHESAFRKDVIIFLCFIYKF